MVETVLVARSVLLVAGVVLLGIAVWTNSNRTSPAMRSFVLFVGLLGTLAVADASAAGGLTSLSVVWLVTFLAIPCAFTWFVVEYYGLPHLVSTWRKGAYLTPALVGAVGGIVLILSPSASGSMAGGGVAAPPLPSPLGFAALAEQAGLYYAGGIMLAGVVLLVRTVSDYEYLDARLGIMLSFVAIWPWLAYFVTPGIVSSVSISSIIGLNATGYALSSGAVIFAISRGRLFDAAPAAGTLGDETVLADLDDAVLVVDHDERVVKLNQVAVETFGDEPAAATAEPLSRCVGTDLTTLRESETVELTVPEGTRHFAASVSPIRDRFDRQPGHAIVIADVTQERIRSQRLTVLNRVLRHNLRNRLSSIMGRAEIIAEGDNTYADSADAILTSADDLVSLSERARQVEEMLAHSPETETDVVLTDIAGRVLDAYRTEYPEAALSVDIDDSLTVSVDSRILRDVLDNLVENALVHNDAPTRVVTISARPADETVRLAVSDNGPGVPEGERAVIEAEDENPLEHGSGLGLWAVKWGIVRLGGELEIRANEPHGTVITIDLPAEPQAQSGSAFEQTIEAD
jgi:signal transduction histidine kinase